MKLDSGIELRGAREALGLSQAKLAELTGIPQYLLSAFELDKSPLAEDMSQAIVKILRDRAGVEKVAGRRKRYRAHTYEAVVHDASRVRRHAPTEENQEYKLLLTQLHSQKRSSQLRTLSLFAGCGGLSLGFSWAGCEVRGFVELDDGLATLYQDNFPNTPRLGADISAMSDDEIETTKNAVSAVDLIVGGPPCQGFSLSGKRSVADPRNTLFLDYLRFVDVYRPKIAIMENVRLLTSMKSPHGGYVRDEIYSEFVARGYLVKQFEVNARDYGVPQHRERIIFVATRRDLGMSPSFPTPTHSVGSDDLFSTRKAFRTFADACSDLAFLESGEKSDDPLHLAVSHPKHVIDWLWDVPEGLSAHDNDDPSMRPPSGYNTTYKRQVWLEPGATVQTTFGMISGCRNVHPIATRALTVREAARLQSFPDEFRFGRTLGTVRTGIGNAVPPLLAYHIAQHLCAKL